MWATDLQTAYNGIETRTALRTQPRRSFGATFLARNNQDAFNTIWQAIAQPFAVPSWAEAQSIAAVGPTDRILSIDAESAQWGSMVLLWDGGTKFVLRNIYNFGSPAGYGKVYGKSYGDVFTGMLLTQAVGDTFTNAYAVPVLPGRIAGDPKYKSLTSGDEWQLNVELEDASLFVPPTPQQYLGIDLDVSQIFGDGSGTITKSRARMDYGVGHVSVHSQWLSAKQSRSIVLEANDALGKSVIINWVYRRKGRAVPVWQPDWRYSVVLAQTGLIAGTLTVQSNTWPEGRKHLAIMKRDGAVVPCEIASTTDNGDGTVTHTFTQPISMDAQDISWIGYLGLWRLDTDTVQLQHEQGVMTTTLKMIEVSA